MHTNYNKLPDIRDVLRLAMIPSDAPVLIEETPSSASLMATVIGSGKLNIRKSPDKNSDVVCVVSLGDVLTIVDIQQDWAHIYTSFGLEGYAMKEYIGPTWYE